MATTREPRNFGIERLTKETKKYKMSVSYIYDPLDETKLKSKIVYFTQKRKGYRLVKIIHLTENIPTEWRFNYIGKLQDIGCSTELGLQYLVDKVRLGFGMIIPHTKKLLDAMKEAE